jgi:hypothetical protein
LTPQPPGIRVSVSNPIVRVLAYTDAEVTGANIGSSYYNLTDGLTHVCTATNPAGCSAWQSNGAGTLTNQPNTWSAVQTFSADIKLTPPAGPSLYLNRAISTSTNTPSNGGSWIFGPGDLIVNGCSGCNTALSFLNLTANNGIPVMMLLKAGGLNSPTQIGDYLGVKLGFSTLTGAQQLGSGIAGNSDMVGRLTLSAATTVTYTWINAPSTPGAYTVHPVCELTPEFDYGTNRFWPTYTGTTSFTINFSGAVTGTVGYHCQYLN